MTDKIKELRARRDAIRHELAELADEEARLLSLYEKRRTDALWSVLDGAMTIIRTPGVRVVNLEEGVELSRDSVIDRGPTEGNLEIAVQMYSAHERKDNVSTADRVEVQNPSYREDEMVVVQFVIPRADLADSLAHIEKLEEL